jgi:tetratricopeptide (TPR) repeat protein
MVSAVCGFIAVEFQIHRSVSGDGTGLGDGLFRLSLAGRVLGFYLQHGLWPHDLAPVYERWKVGGFGWWAFWIGLAAVLVWQRERWGRAVLLGLGWFVLNLVPVLGFVGISYLRFSWVMDHLAYASLIGLAGLAAAGLQWLARTDQRVGGNSLHPGGAASRWAAGLLGGAVVLALAAGSRAYVPAYTGEEAIWTYTAEHQPRQWMGLGNLGAVRINQGRIAEAGTLLRRAAELNPDVPDIHRNLSVVESLSGRTDAAVAEARQALKLRPDYPLALMDLGTYLAQQGKAKESLPYWEEALRLAPYSADLRNRYGYVLLMVNRVDEGLAQIKQALALDPDWGPAEFNWALVLTQQRHPEEAFPHFERAARLMPGDPNVQKQYALAAQRRGGRR